MHAAERPQERAQSRACTFAGIAVHFAHTIPIVITCPLVLRVIDRGMRQIQPMITAVLVRIDDRRITGHGFTQNPLAGGLITVADYPTALFAGLPTDDMNDGWAVIVIGTMPRLLIGAPPRRIVGVGMGRTFFPQRSGRVHPPRRSDRPSDRLTHSRSGWFGAVAATCGRFAARAGVRGPSVRSIRPWSRHGARAPTSPGVGESLQRPCRSTRYSNHRRPGTDRRHSSLGRGSAGGRRSRSAGRRNHPGAGVVPARACTGYRQTAP